MRIRAIIMVVSVLVQLVFLPVVSALPKSNSIEVLVNKQHLLQPIMYVPTDLTLPGVLLAPSPTLQELELRSAAARALTQMFAAASKTDLQLVLASAYRSYNSQFSLYNQLLASEGSVAQETVAPPGASEHQTGLAADIILRSYICAAQGCFAITRAASWLEANSYKFGFILRYPAYKEAVTGYAYEPWHYRYVGVALATKLHATRETLEEYYGL